MACVIPVFFVSHIFNTSFIISECMTQGISQCLIVARIALSREISRRQTADSTSQSRSLGNGAISLSSGAGRTADTASSDTKQGYEQYLKFTSFTKGQKDDETLDLEMRPRSKVFDA